VRLFEYKILIKESDLDTFGHVNNARYLSLFEEARWDMIHSRGYGLREVQARGQGPVVLEINIRFQREVKLRDVVTIQTSVLEPETVAEKLTMRLEQRMLNAKNEICCSADFTFGLFDLKTRKLILPTPEWLHAIGVPN
jgi:YbgC/YbaW family acyl-CoA thioester hydrolase